MSRDAGQRLDDILQFARDTIGWTSGQTEEFFRSNELLFRDVLYNLQVIGEAVKGLPPEVRALKSDIPWRAISGLRDVVTHAYFRVDRAIVWEVTTEQLPLLVAAVIEMKSQLASQD